MGTINIAVIGECMIELSGQPFKTMQQSFGGDIVNTAIYLKQLAKEDINVHFVSSVGQDALSDALIKQWQHHGIDTTHVLKNKDKHVGLYMIQNDAQGERVFHYWRNDSAARYLMQRPEIDHVFEALESFDAIYLSGISLAILPAADCETLLVKLANIRELGVSIIYDSNYRSALWQYSGSEIGLSTEQSLERAKTVNKQMFAITDLALITLDDEQALWQDTNLESCRDRLEQFGIKELVLKDGANGCQHSSKGSHSLFPTDKVAQVIDTTAAGDSFNAGFLSYWLREQPIAACAKAGNLTAGQVIQKKGAVVDINIQAITHQISSLITKVHK